MGHLFMLQSPLQVQWLTSYIVDGMVEHLGVRRRCYNRIPLGGCDRLHADGLFVLIPHKHSITGTVSSERLPHITKWNVHLCDILTYVALVWRGQSESFPLYILTQWLSHATLRRHIIETVSHFIQEHYYASVYDISQRQQCLFFRLA